MSTETPTGTAARPRRTQPERRAASRAALLDAAAKLVAAHGYEATRVDAISDAAGLSKGALYFHFDGKEDLFTALLEERIDPRVERLAALARDASAEESTAGALSAGLHRMVTRERELVLLALEQAVQATRNAAVRRPYLKRMRRLRGALASATTALHRRTGVPLPLPADELALAYLALAQGLALMESVDPGSVPESLYGQMLQLVFAGAAAQSGATEPPTHRRPQ